MAVGFEFSTFFVNQSFKALKTHPNLAKDESKFAAEVIKRKVSEQELTKEYQKQKKKWEKMGRPVSFIKMIFLLKNNFRKWFEIIFAACPKMMK